MAENIRAHVRMVEKFMKGVDFSYTSTDTVNAMAVHIRCALTECDRLDAEIQRRADEERRRFEDVSRQAER
jgi:hypothetical protein